MTAPENLKLWRTAKGLSLRAAAALVGVSVPSWHAWEAGTKCPTLERARLLQRLTHGSVTPNHWADFAESKAAR